MPFLPQGASAQTVTVYNVQFKVSLGLFHVSQASTTEPTKVEEACDVGTYVLSTSPMDSMTHIERDHFDADGQPRNINHDDDFFILTDRYHTVYDSKNTFS